MASLDRHWIRMIFARIQVGHIIKLKFIKNKKIKKNWCFKNSLDQGPWIHKLRRWEGLRSFKYEEVHLSLSIPHLFLD